MFPKNAQFYYFKKINTNDNNNTFDSLKKKKLFKHNQTHAFLVCKWMKMLLLTAQHTWKVIQISNYSSESELEKSQQDQDQHGGENEQKSIIHNKTFIQTKQSFLPTNQK